MKAVQYLAFNDEINDLSTQLSSHGNIHAHSEMANYANMPPRPETMGGVNSSFDASGRAVTAGKFENTFGSG